MKRIHRAAFGAAFYALLPLPASAQWQGSIGAGARSATHTEYDLAGRQLVSEDGWLPGASVRAGYRQGSVTWFGGADWYQGDIDYRGRTQAGAAAVSSTSTRLAAARLGASYAWGSYSILAAFEIDHWKRGILGTAASAGLQETYRSRRLLLGAGKTWRPAAGAVSLDAAAILAEPERMRIGFSGLFDPVSLDTRRAHGLRLGADLRPAWAPSLQLRSRIDWLRVPRSGAAALTANGAFRGTVTQPEHVRRALTLELAYLF
jgi:hypothetical protein